MFNLIMAILSSASTSIFMRVSEKHIRGKIAMLAVNYIVCSAVAALYVGSAGLFPTAQEGFSFALGLGGFNGILYLVSFVLLQWNVGHNGVVIASTFMKLGVMVPITVAVLFYGEQPGIPQLIGYAGALCAIALIHFDGESGSAHSRLPLLLLPLLAGGGSAMSKVFERAMLPALEPHFLFYTFAFALVLCLALVVKNGERIGSRELFFGALVGVPNFFSARFMLRCLNSIPAVIAYPIYSVGCIVVASLAGVIFFRERLTRRRWIALAIIMCSIVLLNL
ncbi:MAG: EamA family transporter [Oscillospiraceae bacterium]|nr:EamA family transporter [Oscillospiraceae bacterium]